MYSKSYLSWLNEIEEGKLRSVGRKASRLFELAKAGFPIPRGFVIHQELLIDISNECFLTGKIEHQLETIDPYNPQDLILASNRIKHLVEDCQIPRKFALLVFEMYEKLGGTTHVSIRGSMSEGAFSVSHNEPFLGIQGDANLLIYIRKMWASYFTTHTIEVLLKQKKLQYHFSIIVEEMIDSQVSGLVYTSSPDGLQKDSLFINATYGIRDEYIKKYPYPDLYQVSKTDFSVTSIESVSQRKALKRIGSDVVETSIELKSQDKQKLQNEQIIQLAKWGKKIHSIYFYPQKIEWAYANNQLYLLDTQPLSSQEVIEHPQAKPLYTNTHLETLITAKPESKGLVTGPSKFIFSFNQIAKIFPGDVVFIENPDGLKDLPLKKIGGLVIKEGNSFDQKIIFLKSSGVPFIIGELVSPYEGVVTLDATHGVLYKGSLPSKVSINEKNEGASKVKNVSPVATKIFADTSNYAEAETHIRNCDGIGLVKSEFLRKLYGIGNDGLKKIYEIANNKLVFYRFFDEHEPKLGESEAYRGALNFLLHPELLKSELLTIYNATKGEGENKLNVVIPFLRTVDELHFIQKNIAEYQIANHAPFKLWVMIETPSAALDLEMIASEQIEGIVIGLNDLTSLIFSIDRENPYFKNMFGQNHRLIEKTVQGILKTAAAFNKPVIVAGEALANSFDVLKYCIKGGAYGVCVPGDAINRVREQIRQIEKEIII